MQNQVGDQNAPRTLSTDAQAMMRFEANKKSTGVAYVLWFFLGYFGGHRFYLGRTGSAIAMLILTIAGWLLLAVIVGIFMLLAVGIWWIVDAFLIPGWIQAHNNRLATKLGAAEVFITRT